MKITGGKFKKTIISSVSDTRTRYTPAIVREALYDIIDVEGKSVLELFGGSGVVSAEAISRSAGQITIVEISRSSCATIRKNLSKLHHPAKIINLDFRIALRRLSKKCNEYDFIFADPPFETGLLLEAFNEIDRHFELIKSEGIVVIESFEKELPPESGKNIVLHSRRKYGDVVLSFYSSSHDEYQSGNYKDKYRPPYNEGYDAKYDR